MSINEQQIPLTVGQRVLIARKAAKKTQQECAEHLQVHLNTYANKEGDRTEFRVSELERLEDFLKTKLL